MYCYVNLNCEVYDWDGGDCVINCGDGFCEYGDILESCLVDCEFVCGNGVCEFGEKVDVYCLEDCIGYFFGFFCGSSFVEHAMLYANVDIVFYLVVDCYGYCMFYVRIEMAVDNGECSGYFNCLEFVVVEDLFEEIGDCVVMFDCGDGVCDGLEIIDNCVWDC